jgi:hypothetical protein
MKLKALQKMKYYVKMAYGTSSDYFTNSFLCPLLGLLQGSAKVCPIWAWCSSVQFEILDQQFALTRFPSPRIGVYTERSGEAFVNNRTLETSSTETLQAVTTRMTAKAQAWDVECMSLAEH